MKKLLSSIFLVLFVCLFLLPSNVFSDTLEEQVGNKINDVMLFSHGQGGLYTRHSSLDKVEGLLSNGIAQLLTFLSGFFLESSVLESIYGDYGIFSDLDLPRLNDVVNNYQTASNQNKSADFDDIVRYINSGIHYNGHTPIYDNPNPSSNLNVDLSKIRTFFNKNNSSTLKYYDYNISNQSINNPIGLLSSKVLANIDMYDFDNLFEKIEGVEAEPYNYRYKNASNVLAQSVMLRELLLKGEFDEDNDPLINGNDGVFVDLSDPEHNFKFSGNEHRVLAIAHSQGGPRTVAYAIDQRLNRSLRYYTGRDLGMWPNIEKYPSPYNGNTSNLGDYLETEDGSLRWDLSPTISGIITVGSPLAGGAPIAGKNQMGNFGEMLKGALIPFGVSWGLSEASNTVAMIGGAPTLKIYYLIFDILWSIISTLIDDAYPLVELGDNILGTFGSAVKRFTFTVTLPAIIITIIIISALNPPPLEFQCPEQDDETNTDEWGYDTSTEFISYEVGEEDNGGVKRGRRHGECDLLPSSKFMKEYFNGSLNSWDFTLEVDPANYVKIPITDPEGNIVGYSWAMINEESNPEDPPTPYIPEFALDDDMANSLQDIQNLTNQAMNNINEIRNTLEEIKNDAYNLSNNIFMLSNSDLGLSGNNPVTNAIVLQKMKDKIKEYYNTLIVLPRWFWWSGKWDSDTIPDFKADPKRIPTAVYKGSQYEFLTDCPNTNIADGGTENTISSAYFDFIAPDNPVYYGENANGDNPDNDFELFTKEGGIAFPIYGSVGGWAYGERYTDDTQRTIHTKRNMDNKYDIMNKYSEIMDYTDSIKGGLGSQTSPNTLLEVINNLSISFESVTEILNDINTLLSDGSLSFNIDALVGLRNFLRLEGETPEDATGLVPQLNVLKTEFLELKEDWYDSKNPFSQLKNNAKTFANYEIYPTYFNEVPVEPIVGVYNRFYETKWTNIMDPLTNVQNQLQKINRDFVAIVENMKANLKNMYTNTPSNNNDPFVPRLYNVLVDFYNALLSGGGNGDTDAGINLTNMTFRKPLSDVYYASITGGNSNPFSILGAKTFERIKVLLEVFEAGAIANAIAYIPAMIISSILGTGFDIAMSVIGFSLWTITSACIGSTSLYCYSRIPDQWNRDVVEAAQISDGVYAPSDSVIATKTAAGSNEYPADKVGGKAIVGEHSDGYQPSHFHFPDAVHGGPVYTSTLLSRKECSERIAWLSEKYIRLVEQERGGNE